MKRLILIFSACIFFAPIGHAQAKHNLKGPAAKNYKPWQDHSKKSPVVFNADPIRLQGPKAKNRKPWDQSQKTQEYIAIKTRKQPHLKGPKAKNWKPWYKDLPEKRIYAKETLPAAARKDPESKSREEKN